MDGGVKHCLGSKRTVGSSPESDSPPTVRLRDTCLRRVLRERPSERQPKVAMLGALQATGAIVGARTFWMTDMEVSDELVRVLKVRFGLEGGV